MRENICTAIATFLVLMLVGLFCVALDRLAKIYGETLERVSEEIIQEKRTWVGLCLEHKPLYECEYMWGRR